MRSCCPLLLGLTVSPAALAQAPTATLTGRTLDANQMRSVSSDLRGSFTITNLAPGRYSVTAEKQGFRRLEETGLELQVNQEARLDLTLAVGAVTESVMVTAAAPALKRWRPVRTGS